MKQFDYNSYMRNNPLLKESTVVNTQSDMDKVAEYLRQEVGDEYADVFTLLSQAHPSDEEMENIALTIPDTKARKLDRLLQDIFAEVNAVSIVGRDLKIPIKPFDRSTVNSSLKKIEDISVAIQSL